ncbi:MAG: hypothetical protein JXR12_01125 [Neptunomonas phycophila]|uniref:hypothetical protein n=1 Tax=Neptunomonas phycophila TaxID=1572645 RepID=UPI003B8B7BA3
MTENDTMPNVGTPGHIDHGSTAPPELVGDVPQFSDEENARLQKMVQRSVQAHGLLKQGKGISAVARACNLPLDLVRDMAKEVNQPEIIALRKRQADQRKTKRKAQTKARKANRRK